jgi:cytosine/adenosine deaminase-related metal-dependent hydrolase
MARRPAEVLFEAGALGPRSTVVHATHLAGRDIELLGGSRGFACFCPTTEADLADGIGPARALASAGSRLSLGSDSQAVIDLFEEARRVELGERLASQRRGHFTAAELADRRHGRTGTPASAGRMQARSCRERSPTW